MPDPKNAFFIPMQLEAKVVDTSSDWQDWAGQLADFSLLPHYAKGENCALPRLRPNISDDLVSKPFQPTNDPLESGIHLHWTLPKEFRSAVIQDTETGAKEPQYQSVPNRWLIEGQVFKSGEPAKYKNEVIQTRRWLLESDALSTRKVRGSCAFPYPATGRDAAGKPDYRYLGRLYDYEEWKTAGADPDSIYLDELNALGYGEILFSGYYPECRNVFGIHDDLEYKNVSGEAVKFREFATDEAYEFRYQVIGWYSKSYQDPMDQVRLRMAELPEDIDKLKTEWSSDEIAARKNEIGLSQNQPAYVPWQPSSLIQDRNQVFDWLVFDLFDKLQTRDFYPYGKPLPAHYVMAGQITERGTGKEIEGAIIYLEGSQIGTASKSNGKFKLTLIGNATSLIVKCKGYETIRTLLPEYAQGTLHIELSPVNTHTAGKSVLTGSIRNIGWNSSKVDEKTAPADSINLVLANTPGQALAALLADEYQNGKEEGGKNMEAMLDALQLGLFNEADKLDFPARLERGLHQSGFEAVPGERRWYIRQERTEDYSGEQQMPGIEKDWSNALHQLNARQTAWDKEAFKIRDRQVQLYADWYKFMITEYDFSLDEITTEAHVNQIRDYVAGAVTKLEKQLNQHRKDKNQIERFAAGLESKLAEWNLRYAFYQIRFSLELQPGTRYWQPTEPVLLFDGLPAQAVKKGSQLTTVGWIQNYFQEDRDQEISQKLVRDWFFDPARDKQEHSAISSFEDLETFSATLRTKEQEYQAAKQILSGRDAKKNLAGLRHKLQADQKEFMEQQALFALQLICPVKDATHLTWQPVYMDWEAEVFPYTKPAGMDANQKDWPGDAIVANYDLPENGADLQLHGTKKQLVENSEDATWSDPYSKETAGDRVQNIQGRTFLTATAALPLIEQLERQLEAVGQKEGYADQVNALKDRNLLSQRLAGFNDVMLMRKPILQLPVTDPLARTEILSDFTNRVRAVVGERNGISPLPANLFLPLREGPFQIRKVRLVDRWGEGRVYEFAKGATSSRVIISQALRTPKEVKGGNSRMAYLPPRLVQPARINFRWLATDHASAEAGTHANNSPICGYVVPNFLDSSIHVFNEAGEGLLVIARSGDTVVERPFPGKQEIIEPKDQLLNKLIHSITGKNRRIKKLNMLKDLLEAARESTGANLPENYAQFDGLALLMGCPLALVRAKLDLELRGEPSINQSWNARETEYFGRERHVHPTLDFEKLRFAVRLGEKHRANDGFFAYFILKGDNLIREVYSPYAKPHTLHASATDLTAEKYWNELSNLKKWLELEEERRNSRKAEEKKLKKRLPAISKRLQELESYHDLTNEDVQEQILLQNAQNELENRAKGLPNEIALIEARITAYNTDIDKLQREHGYKSSGLGLYKPHGDLLTLSAEADELHLGILMDPRSPVHLTTGVLPEKRIDIPPDLFADALNNIQMAFLTTPVISPEPVWQAPESESDELVQQPFLLTAPFQPGYEWSWLQPGATEKENIHFPADQIQEPRTGYFQPAGPQIIFDGWMKLQPTTTKPSSTSDKTDRDE